MYKYMQADVQLNIDYELHAVEMVSMVAEKDTAMVANWLPMAMLGPLWLTAPRPAWLASPPNFNVEKVNFIRMYM